MFNFGMVEVLTAVLRGIVDAAGTRSVRSSLDLRRSKSDIPEARLRKACNKFF